MKTLETFFYSGLKSLHFGKQLLRYLMVFLSAFFRSRASLGYELVAMRSQLTFLRNHLQVSWAMDFFTIPTIRFQILYVFVVLNHSRRQVVNFAVTAHPTMAWVIQQLREAMPFGLQPRYMFRDNDGIYGDEVSRFLVGTGIEQVKTAYRSPWQNPFLERYIGTLRRELLNHVIILSEEHLKGLLKEFIEEYYHIARPHQGLDGDPPFPAAKSEPVTGARRLVSIPVVGGLHHRYVRMAA